MVNLLSTWDILSRYCCAAYWLHQSINFTITSAPDTWKEIQITYANLTNTEWGLSYSIFSFRGVELIYKPVLVKYPYTSKILPRRGGTDSYFGSMKRVWDYIE